MIKPKHLLAKWTNKDPSTSLSCTKGINNEVLSFIMWNSNTVVTWNDTYASRSGKCRHSQNEPKLRSWSLCVILSDHCIIVPHLNDKWFFFHKLYHPKLLCFINMGQWYCEILILAHFANDGTCQILKHKCHSKWPLYYCSTF